VIVDHSGAAPVLVVGGQRFTMDDLRRAAVGMPIEVRTRVEQTTAAMEYAHTLWQGLELDDEDR
jgi:hypothetical protein